MDFLSRLLDTSDFPPRWTCGRWTPAHGWLHILSDLGIWSAYFAIPLVFGYFLARRRDLPFRSILILFAAFILLCGTTHLMEAAIFWWPAYRLAGLIKVATAVVSWVTVLALVRVAPLVIDARSPDELERVVRERTAELAEANRRLREEQNRLDFVARSCGVGFYMNEMPLGRLRWDDTVKAHFHLPPDAEIDIDTFYDRLHPDDREPVRRSVERAIEAGDFAAEYRTIRPADGAERWVRAVGRLTYRPDGTPERFDGITLDVTPQKRTEARLRESEAHLLRAMEALQEADRRKDIFLATLAHELRNPLAPIRNAVHLLRETDPAAPVSRGLVQVIDRQTTQLVHLIEDLLDLNRIARGQVILRVERVPLAEVVEVAVEACRPLIESRGHTLAVDLPREPIAIDADPVRLAQVLTNLLTNAAKYTDPGGRIRLSAGRQGDAIVLTVADSGIGIPPERIATIFEMFAQLGQADDRSRGGLGIGLSLARELVQLHGGTLTAESRGPGTGSTFTIRIPSAIAPTPIPTPPPADTTSPQAVQGRILVVDDNPDGAESIAMLLRILGGEVRTARDGLEAIAEAEAFRPDLILMDLGMPRMDGYTAARRIREEPWGRDIRIVAQSGWGGQDERRRSAEAGFDAHVVKPVEIAALLELIAGLPTPPA